MRHPRGMTLIEVVVVIMIFVLLGGMMFSGTSCGARRTANQMKNSSQLRAVQQASSLLAANNNGYLPGMNSSGFLLDSTDAAFSSLADGNTGTPGLGGGAVNTRFYLLLNGNFIAPEWLINPLDKVPAGKPGPASVVWSDRTKLPLLPTLGAPGQVSYALPNIADSALSGSAVGTRSPGRVAEWHDSANSQAVVLVDRNIAGTTLSPRSIWATSTGNATDWKGNVVWGDGHSEFLISSTGLKTKYAGTINSADSLFHDGAEAADSGEGRDNAFFNAMSANY